MFMLLSPARVAPALAALVATTTSLLAPVLQELAAEDALVVAARLVFRGAAHAQKAVGGALFPKVSA